MKFRINYIAPEKKLVFFIEIALNSYINLGITGIFIKGLPWWLRW